MCRVIVQLLFRPINGNVAVEALILTWPCLSITRLFIFPESRNTCTKTVLFSNNIKNRVTVRGRNSGGMSLVSKLYVNIYVMCWEMMLMSQS